MKIGIIGKGRVGTAIGTGLTRVGHEVKYGHRDPMEPVSAAAEWGDALVLAVPFEAIPDVVKEIGTMTDGKVLIDVTNAVTQDWGLAVGWSTSAAEELQNKLPEARVVKAFNTVFAPNQSTGKVGEEQLTFFVASDDAKAKATVMQLGRDIGFEPLDAGPLKSARYLEPMAILLMNMAFVLGMGTSIGFKFVKA